MLANHVVPSEADSDAIKGAIADSGSGTATFDTLGGGSLEATEDGEDLVVSPAGSDVMAMVVTPDVETCAGVVHVVDMVLVPAGDAADAPAASPEAAEACTPLGEAATEAGLTALVDAITGVAVRLVVAQRAPGLHSSNTVAIVPSMEEVSRINVVLTMEVC